MATFISYAQNFEDVILWRALKHVENGFYIYAGAWSPDEDSVTRAFYERGWRGINIEPNPAWIDKLREKRSEDINLPFALGEKEETINLHIVVDITGLSTTDENFAEKNKEKGQSIQTIPCQTTTMNIVWNEYVGKKQVHFLKIDVEGAETSVLRGNDWKEHRPWVILIESVYPNTQSATHHLWEHILLDNDYIHVYYDGINRYYLANEHADLSTAFTCPPNIFDEFKLSAHAQAEENLNRVSTQHEELLVRYEELSRQHQILKTRHTTALYVLSELQKTKGYRWLRQLGQWEWLEKEITKLVNPEIESDKFHDKNTK
jgi:FkbM family methyltransferase